MKMLKIIEDEVILMSIDVLQGNQLDVIKSRTSVLSSKHDKLHQIQLCCTVYCIHTTSYRITLYYIL